MLAPSGQGRVLPAASLPRRDDAFKHRWDAPLAELQLPTAMYAVIGAGAGQLKVEEGQRVHVDLLDAAEGDEVTLTAKMVVDGDTVLATPDQLGGVTVTATVVGEAKGPKINGFTYKRRTNQRRRFGHRQRYTVVEITKIATR
jgi:large subunit ribosomal protein L21